MAKDRDKKVITADGEQPEAFWKRFLQSVGGAALISALLGTQLSGYINAATAERAKTTESQRKTIELRLAAYKEYLDQQRDVVLRASEMMGRCVAASEELIALTDPAFDPSRYDDGLQGQRVEIKEKFNVCAREWNTEYNKLSILMGYYHTGQPAVAAAWGEVQRATAGYMECAQQWYVNNSAAPVATAAACKAEKEELKRGVDEFSRQLGAARQYVWQELQSAERPAEGGPAARQPGRVGLVGE